MKCFPCGAVAQEAAAKANAAVAIRIRAPPSRRIQAPLRAARQGRARWEASSTPGSAEQRQDWVRTPSADLLHAPGRPRTGAALISRLRPPDPGLRLRSWVPLAVAAVRTRAPSSRGGPA